MLFGIWKSVTIQAWDATLHPKYEYVVPHSPSTHRTSRSEKMADFLLTLQFWLPYTALGKYIIYVETPYFIFVKDSISYITLLGLHFALCLAKSTVPFSSLEWVILVFFVARIVNEVWQFVKSKDTANTRQRNGEPISKTSKQFRKYLR